MTSPFSFAQKSRGFHGRSGILEVRISYQKEKTMANNILHKGDFTFQRVVDGAYLTFETDNDTALGVVFTNDERGRKWNAVDTTGVELPRSFRTMSLAADALSGD